MWRPAAALLLSPSETAILKTMAVSSEIPPRVRRRVQIILKAAAGLPNLRIARELKISRAAVLGCRACFATGRIRSLWRNGRAPRTAVRSKLEASLVFTVSFLPPDMFHLPPGATTLRWTVRNVAMRFGVSVATAQRIMAKHGLQTVRGSLRPHGKKRWQGPSLKNFKISQDPLFGVTISGIAGLFFESTGPVLALCCDGRPLSELHLSELPPTGVEERFEALLVEIRKLQYRLVGFFLPPENDLVDADGFNTLLRLHPNWQVYSDLDERRPDGARFRPRGLLIPSKDKLLRFLDVIDSKRPRDGKIYLLAGGEHSGADTDPVVRQWLAEHRDFKLRYAPFPAIIDWETRAWMEWIQKWINVMTAFPVQAELLDDIAALTSHLRQLPTRPHLDTILIA